MHLLHGRTDGGQGGCHLGIRELNLRRCCGKDVGQGIDLQARVRDVCSAFEIGQQGGCRLQNIRKRVGRSRVWTDGASVGERQACDADQSRDEVYQADICRLALVIGKADQSSGIGG